MDKYNGSVLRRWNDNAERELYLNTTSHDLNESNVFGLDSEELQSGESWIDLKRYKESSQDISEEDEDDDSKTIRLNDSGNEDESIHNYTTTKSTRSISFEKNKISFDELDDAMNTDLRPRINRYQHHHHQDGFDLNTSLTTILSKEKQHPLDVPDENEISQQQLVFMDVSNSSSMISNSDQSQSDNISFKSKKRKKNHHNNGSSSGISKDYGNTIVFMSIVASLSFSAGYALGQSKRH